MCAMWYEQRAAGQIKSTNFQLHPPRFRDEYVFTNKCGNLSYPLLFAAVRKENGYEKTHYEPSVLENGECHDGSGDLPLTDADALEDE